MARFIKKRNTVGEAPGSIVFIGKQKMDHSRLRLLSFNEKELNEYESENVEDLMANYDEERVNWFNIDGVHDSSVIEKIGAQFQLSPLVLEDIANTDQRPKVFEDAHYLAVFVKLITFDREDEKIHADQISIILGKDFIITFQEQVGTFFDPIRKRLRENIGKIRQRKADYLLYRILDTVADHYMLNTSQMAELVEEIEEVILTTTSKEVLGRIYRNKTEISYIRKAVRPVVEISKYLKNFDSDLFNQSTKPFLNDLDDIVTHTLETIDIYSTMVSDHLNIYNTNLSNRSNEVMKVLTIFASIFIPLTFIAGVYGTNFEYIPELSFRPSYFIMWGVMIVVAVLMLLFFRKNKWL